MAEKFTIIDFVERYTREFATHTFLREKVNGVWTETSFEDTRKEAHRIGAGLMSLGLEKGDKVALLSEGRNLWVLGELGILYAGGVNVPLSIKLEESNDLTFRIQHSDAKYIMVSMQQLAKIRTILPDCPNVEKVIVFDEIEDLQEKEITIKEIIELGDKYLLLYSNLFEERYQSIQNDDYANISYTSGTTADPKGILLTHRNYTANVEQAHSVIGIDMDDVMLIVLPLDHCFAHVAGFYTMMSYGGSIATVPVGKNSLATLKNIPGAIADIKPHVMLSVPAIARTFKKNIENGVKKKGATVEKLYNFALHNAIKYYKEYYNAGGNAAWRKPLVKFFDKIIFSSVRQGLGGRMKFFVGGGALLDIELQRFYNAIGIPMFQGYGLSEATPIICANAPGHAIFGSSGRTVKPMDIKICDGEGNALPFGEKGEIVIRGENVMAGYWKNPKATAETVIDGWLHTGDMGYIPAEHPDYLYVVGRFKSLLISADGEKYSPEGFEDSLTEASKFIDGVVLHNNQDPYTMVMIVPNRENLLAYAKKQKLDIKTDAGIHALLALLQGEVNAYRKGGKFAGMFPERWLPTAIAVLPEPFTEQNHMVNSSLKVVRGKVEKHYEDRIEYAYTSEGKDIANPQNVASLKQILEK